MGDSTPFTVRRLNGALGAEVTSINLTAALDNATFEPLRQAFLDNCVLVFPDQNLDAESLLHFGQRWGKPIFAHHYPTRLKDCLEVIKVLNYGKRKTVTENWHSDWAFWPTPPSISIPQIAPRRSKFHLSWSSGCGPGDLPRRAGAGSRPFAS